MITTPDPFDQRYRQLNDAQKDAVDTVYGPVMVIAGPGTGKTEVLAMRIAALLRSEAQVQPHDILCLTYSDEAANAMRARLVKIIGPAAHRVTVCTFHGFCNGVIQTNPEYFPARSQQVISELEKADLMRAIVDELPDGHPLRRYGAAPYFDIPNLNALFEFMKREAVTPEMLSEEIDRYLGGLKEREDYRYRMSRKGKFEKGEIMHAKYDAEVQRMEKTRAAGGLFTRYNEQMREEGRYDYSDMILWVLEAFAEHHDLLLRAQEKYQFILVDEFQDTNGAQLALINALSDFWEAPNIFVVGDDDQSVYEFQGARLRNITDFYERHRDDVKVIVLPHNYRSSQPVLNVAGATIAQNRQRLINQLLHLNLTKDLVSSNSRFTDGADTEAPQVLEFGNPVQEEAWVLSQIERLAATGVDLCDIAVIYSQHKQGAGLIGQLERRGIPFNAKRPANVLDAPLVQTVVNVLRYIQLEKHRAFSGEALLFDFMHAPVFGLEPSDTAAMAVYLQSKPAKESVQLFYRQLLDNPMLLQTLGLRNEAAAVRLGNLLNRWLAQSTIVPLTLLLEMILHESGLVARTLSATQPVWDMQALRTFFEFVKNTCTAAPRTGIGELMAVLVRMDEEGISLKLERVVQQDAGVCFYTAHGAKGSEFEYVFIIGANKQFWEGRSASRGFKLPDGLTNTADRQPQSNEEEVARRLFYVALTRAKKHLFVSYARQSHDGNVRWDASLFVDEISRPEDRIRPKFESGLLLRYLNWAMQPLPPVQIVLAQHQWIDRILRSSFTLSPSTLNKYLRCPVAFYYENLLKVPVQGASFFSFGSAAHYALEIAFIEMKKAAGEWPAQEVVINAFERALYSEKESMTPAELGRRLEQGRSVLSAYYTERLLTLHRDAEIEYKVGRYLLDDAIPVTGRIDKIEKYSDGCVVVDYKTGKPANVAKKLNPPSANEPNGGDYWRQMVFYKILLEGYAGSPWRVKLGFFDMLEKTDRGHYEPKTVPIFPADITTVKEQIRDSWRRIQNHEFDTGCGEPSCHWCNFARRHELVRPVVADDELTDEDDA